MGEGIDLARDEAPEHTEILDNFKDQLLLAMVKRLGENVSIPFSELDETGQYVLAMAVTGNAFHFKLSKKQ